jgi:hypothetical protein
MNFKYGFSILIVAFALRIGYVLLFFDPTGLEVEDQQTYLSMAEAVLQGRWSALTPDRAPGYPLFLAGVFWLLGEGYLPLLILQALIDSLTCVLIGFLAFKVLGSGLILAGMVAAFNLNMIILSSMALTDSFFLFLFTLSLLFSVSYLLEQKSAYFVASIAVLSAATMVRSASYYLLPLPLMLFPLIEFLRGGKLRPVLILAAVGFLVSGATLLPQHWRNWEGYQATEFVSQGGTHLLGWVVPAAHQYSGAGGYEEGQELARNRLEEALKHDGFAALPIDPFAASSYRARVARSLLNDLGFYKVMKAWIVGAAINMAVPSAAFAPPVRAMDHPSFYSTPGDGASAKIWNYVTETSGFKYLLILAVGTLTSLGFFLFFLIGWSFAWPGKYGFPRSILICFTIVIIYFLAITGPIIGSKYRLPIEPVMTVFVVYALKRVTRSGAKA